MFGGIAGCRIPQQCSSLSPAVRGFLTLSNTCFTRHVDLERQMFTLRLHDIIKLSVLQIRQMSVQTEKSSTTESTSATLPSTRKRNTHIIRVDPADYEDSAVGKPKPSLATRRGEPVSIASSILWKVSDEPGKLVDELSKMQTEIDLRPSALKRLFQAVQAEHDIIDQTYKAERVAVLGRDLGAAHFIVARKGRIKFMGHLDWTSTYQRDVDRDEAEDLPSAIELSCTLPVRYDPNYRVEALDAAGINIRYEGLMNFGGLNYLKWLSFRDNKFFDDFCLDRVFCNHGETLEYLDLSGCPGITLNGIAAVARLKKLKTLVVESLPHIRDLEVLCAVLEDQIPGLTCVGVDFERKLTEMRKEAAELEERAKREAAALEANTVEVVPRENIDESISNRELDSKARKEN